MWDRPGVGSSIERVFEVGARWDPDADMYVAQSDDVPGLAMEAATFEELVLKLHTVVPELLRLNGVVIEGEDGGAAVLVHLTAERLVRVGSNW